MLEKSNLKVHCEFVKCLNYLPLPFSLSLLFFLRVSISIEMRILFLKKKYGVK